jgi:hypothetical protein
MRRILIAALFATACWLSASVGHSAITHYNVDKQTLPNGPVELVINGDPTFDSGLNQYTFSFGAKNNFVTTQEDVRFLLQFVFDPAEAFSFDDGTNVWSNLAASKTMSFPGLTEFPMSDTDAPLLWSKAGPIRNASLLATDSVPQVVIGDIGPLSTVNFGLIVQVSAGFNNFNVVGSFVSLPLPEGGPNTPEPSTFALLSVGAAGLFVMRRRRNRR